MVSLRVYGDKFLAAATDRVMPYTFELASAIAQDTLEGQFDAVHLVYNEFVSAIAYTPSIKASLLPTYYSIYPSIHVCMYALPFRSVYLPVVIP